MIRRVSGEREAKVEVWSQSNPCSARNPLAHLLLPTTTFPPRVARMKVTINHHHAVAVWKWELKPKKPGEAAAEAGDSDGEDDDDDVCGICRVSYDGCCPDCKVPGDDCPLSAFFCFGAAGAAAGS